METSKLETQVERQTIQMLVQLMYEHGIMHGLLAGLTALIRGAYESEGLMKALLDAALCTVIGTFVFSLPGFESIFSEHPRYALVAAIVIGVIGANLIITTLRDTFTAALKQLNPLTWFKKTK